MSILGHQTFSRNSCLNAADILSRSPGVESYENDYESTEQFVCYVAQNAVPKAMTIAEIQEASEKVSKLKNTLAEFARNYQFSSFQYDRLMNS
jgi:hypothetical protein